MEDLAYRKYTKPGELDKSVNTLKGILAGIKADCVIDKEETAELFNWCSLHAHLANRMPFCEIIPVVQKSLSDGIITDEELSDMLWVCERVSTKNTYYDAVTASLQLLHGLLHGVLSNGVLNDLEIIELSKWIEENGFLVGMYPYDEINSLLASVLSDGVISDDERNMLVAYFGNFIDTTLSYNINSPHLEELREQHSVSGICVVSPNIVIPDNVFCFTGESPKMSRPAMEELVASLGGLFRKNPSSKTDFLVVGSCGNPCWAFSCYGRKVEKTMELRKQGAKTQIVSEDDFWNAVQMYKSGYHQ